MKSVEEIKTEIINNSYPVELSNGQTIYVDRITSSKAVSYTHLTLPTNSLV